MRIVTWNIRHGGGKRIDRLIESIAAHSPDVLVLTEFRNNPNGDRLRDSLRDLGLNHHTQTISRPSTNTLLIAAKQEFAAQTFPQLCADAHRCTFVRIGDLNVFGLYFPQNRAKEPLFQFLTRLASHFLREPTLLIGDFNTGKHRIDETGATFYCAKYLEELESLGWCDVWRMRNPVAREFTWFSANGNGFRIDHAFTSPALLSRVHDVGYSHVERVFGVSDHSLMWLQLK